MSQGLLYVIDRLGTSLAQTEEQLQIAQARIAELEKQVSEKSE